MITREHTNEITSHLALKAGDRILAVGVISELTYNPFANQPNFWRTSFNIQSMYDLSEENWNWLVDLYKISKQNLPNSKLYYSDFLIEFGGNKADEVFYLVSRLKEREASIDAIAFQMHLQGKDLDSPKEIERAIEALSKEIKRYNDIGVEVIVTELDINMREVSGTPEERTLKQARAYMRIIESLIGNGVNTIVFFQPV